MKDSNVPIRGSFLFINLKIMEKEQILSAINEKLGNTNFSEKTISDYIDANLPAEGTEPDDAYFDKHVGFLKSLYGNFSADVAKQVNEAKAKLKPAPAQKKEPDDDTRYAALEEKFDKLMGNYEKLTEQLSKKESEQTQAQLMSKIKAEMKRQGCNDEYVLRQTLRDVEFDTKKSVSDLTKEMLAKYDSEFTDCRGKGAAPRNGGQSEGSKEKTAADGYFARKAKKEGWGKQSEK